MLQLLSKVSKLSSKKKRKMKKIPAFLTILFLVCSIKILFEEKHDLIYAILKEPYDLWQKNFSICIPLTNFKFNRSLFINSSIVSLKKLKNEIFNVFKNSKNLNELILESDNKINFYFSNYHFCLITLISMDWILSNNFKNISYFIFEDEQFEFFMHGSDKVTISQLLMINHPYSGCKENYSKFQCLNFCFRSFSKHPSLRYHFAGNEEIYVDFNAKNEMNLDDKNFCLKKCKKHECEVNLIYKENDSHKVAKKIIKAYPLIEESDFWIQFTGLISLILNISFYQIILIFTRKFKKIKLRYFYFIIQILISTVLLILVSYLFHLNYKDHNLKSDYPLEREISNFLIDLEDMNLAICFRYDGYYEKTSYMVEKETEDFFKENLDQIYLDVLNKRKEVPWVLSGKVLFMRRRDAGEKFQRCFQIKIILNEAKYENILSISRLVIKMKEHHYNNYTNYNFYKPVIRTFLIPEEKKLENIQILDDNTYELDKMYSFSKKAYKRSRFSKDKKCINYYERYKNCINRLDCFNKCIAKSYLKNNSNLTDFAIIDKDHYTPWQWQNYYFIKKSYEKELENCSSKFERKDCYEVNFVRKDFISDHESSYYLIDLHYETHFYLKDEPNVYKLTIDLLNYPSMVFGLNVLKLFFIVFGLLKVRFKSKENKMFLFLIYLICLCGFSINTYITVKQTLDEELIPNQFWSLADEFKFFDVVICFDINKTLVDENHKLTVNYLEKISDHMNDSLFFEKIEILNEFNKWIILDASKSFEVFYFLDKKCFLLKTNLTAYKIEQFYYNTNTNILRIKMKESVNSKKKFYLFTKKKNSIEFNKIFTLNYDYQHFSIDQEILEVEVNDKFDLIKNPLALFYEGSNNLNDINSYNLEIISKLWKQFNITTLKLPVEKDRYDLNIDNNMFKQYYKQVRFLCFNFENGLINFDSY